MTTHGRKANVVRFDYNDVLPHLSMKIDEQNKNSQRQNYLRRNLLALCVVISFFIVIILKQLVWMGSIHAIEHLVPIVLDKVNGRLESHEVEEETDDYFN
jgi:uncharacterized membrane protein YdbT with pleckstrin-like domain